MEPDTFRGHTPPDVYWRRRAVVLAGILVLVAAVAWACSGGGGRERTAGAGESPTLAPSPARAAPVPTVTVSVTPSPAPTTEVTAERLRKGGRCRPKDMVLNLTGGREVYGKGKTPEFTVTAVHVGEGSCKFDVGTRELKLKITSGNDRIWSSADCVKGRRDVRRFPRGVPYIKTITWDRKRSTKSCGRRPKSGAGTYVAVARAGKLKTGKSVFHLR